MNFESIHNYYEKLVIEHIMEHLVGEQQITDQDFLEDVACLALNQLPARYVRHDVDTAFYLSSKERHEMALAVTQAIETAAEHIRRHGSEQRPTTISQ